MRIILFLISSSLFFLGCALPPPDISGQNFVPESDLLAVRFVREGLQFMSKSRFLDAEMRFRKAEFIDPTSLPIQQNIAISLYKQERFDEAASLFAALSERDPLSIPLLVWLGKATYDTGKRDAGLALLHRALSVATERDDIAQMAAISRALATLYFAQGNEEDAVCFSSQATVLSWAPIDVYRHARLLSGMGFYSNSNQFIDYFNTAGVPKTNDMMVVQGLNRFTLGEYTLALDALKQALLVATENRQNSILTKILIFYTVRHLQHNGSDIEQDVVSEDQISELITDPIMQGAPQLFLSKRLLELMQEANE